MTYTTNAGPRHKLKLSAALGLASIVALIALPSHAMAAGSGGIDTNAGSGGIGADKQVYYVSIGGFDTHSAQMIGAGQPLLRPDGATAAAAQVPKTPTSTAVPSATSLGSNA